MQLSGYEDGIRFTDLPTAEAWCEEKSTILVKYYPIKTTEK